MASGTSSRKSTSRASAPVLLAYNTTHAVGTSVLSGGTWRTVKNLVRYELLHILTVPPFFRASISQGAMVRRRLYETVCDCQHTRSTISNAITVVYPSALPVPTPFEMMNAIGIFMQRRWHWIKRFSRKNLHIAKNLGSIAPQPPSACHHVSHLDAIKWFTPCIH